MFTHYISNRVNGFSDEVFEEYVKYHFAICERQDIIGVSNHTLDILKKQEYFNE